MQIRLQCTWGYRHLFKLLFSFSSENVILFSIFWGTFILFPQLLHRFKFPPTVYKDFLFSISLPNPVIFSSFLMIAILTGMKRCLQVVLICIFLRWLILLSIFTYIHWPCLGIPWYLTGKEVACNAGDLDSIPGLREYPGEGKGYPFHDYIFEKKNTYQLFYPSFNINFFFLFDIELFVLFAYFGYLALIRHMT